MNTQQYDVAMLGRWLGLAIIVIGVIFSIWNASDLGDFAGGDDKFRYFVTSSLQFIAWGGFVYLAAEIVDRLGRRPPG